MDRLALLSQLAVPAVTPPVVVVPVAASPEGGSPGRASTAAAVERLTSSVLSQLRRSGIPAVCDWSPQRKLYLTLRVRFAGERRRREVVHE